MNEIFKLLGSIGVDTGEAETKIDRLRDKAKKAGDYLNHTFNNISKDSANMAGKIALGLGTMGLAIGGFSIKAAGDMAAMNAQFTQVFGKLEKDAQANVNGMAKEFNMVPNRIKPMFSKMTSMFMGLGMDTKQAMGEAEKATRMTADAAAFYDTSFEDANAALSSFIKGNYEGGEAIGIFANDTQMAAYAVKKGLVSETKEWANLDEATKQATRLEYAQNMQKLGGVTGQAAREATGMENVMGNLKQSVSDLGAAFGAPLLQPFLNSVNALSQGMSKLSAILQANPQLVFAIIGAVTTLATAFGAVYVAGNRVALMASLVSKSTALFGAMANPVFLVVAAIGALVTAFIYFYNTSAPFKAFVDNLIPALKDGLGKSIDYVSAAFKAFSAYLIGTVVPAMTAFGNALKAGIVSGLAKMGTSVQGVKDTLGGAFTATLSVVGGLLDKMGGSFGKIGAIAGFVASVLAKVGIAALGITGPWGLLAGAVASFLIMWAKTGELNTDGISQVFDNLGNMIQNFSSLVSQYLPIIVTIGTNLIVQLAAGIAQAIPMITTTFISILNVLVTVITTALPLIINAGVQLITMLVQGIVTALPVIISAALSVINALVNALVLLLPLIINAGVQLITSLINGFVQALPAIITAVTTVIQTLLTTLIMLLPMILAAGIQILMALINGIISILPQLIAAALNIIITLAMALIGALPQIIAAGIQILMALINGIISILPALISAAIQIIIALATTLITNLPKIIAAGVQLLLALISGILQILPQLISAGIRLIIALAGAILQNLPKLLGAGVQLVGALISGLLQMIGQLLGIGIQLASKVIGGIGNMLGGMRNAGVNFVMGFVNGIKDKVGDAVNAAADMGKKAVGAVKSFLNIHSPSRVMLEIGTFTGAGFVNGINSMKDRVQKASDGLAEAALIDPALNDETLTRSLNVRGSVPNEKPTSLVNESIDWPEKFEALMAFLRQYLPEIAQQKQIVMDTGALVGSTRKETDKQLGRDSDKKDRGRAE